MTTAHDIAFTSIDGAPLPLSKFAGHPVLVVNVASKCGLTPQYEGLEQLYRSYRDQGLVVLGFPCNQFGLQEPGSETEIAAFCDLNYNVTFPMFSKIVVNGRGVHPLYQWLRRRAPGVLGLQAVKWNFTKFLIDPTGEKVTRFGSDVEPATIAAPIEALLGKRAVAA